MRYAFIHRERPRYPVALLCQVLQVSRSGYYAFLKKVPTASDHAVLAQVRRLHYASRRTYGQRRLCQALRAEGVRVGREPVFDVTGVTNLKGQIEHLDAQIFVDNFREARRVAAGFGIQLYYSGASMKQRETFCGAGNASNFLVTSRGIVTSCNEVLQPSDPRAKLFQYGEWNQELGEFIVDREAIDRLGRLNVHEMPKCQGCIAKYNCAGDCYAKSASSNGDPAATGYTERCHITRELLKDNLLIGLISSMAGAHAGEPDQHSCRM